MDKRGDIRSHVATQNNSTPRSLHTSGPWCLDDRYPGKVYCDDALGSLVAECGPFRFTISERHKEVGANARLIAAAPELLEALRNLVTEIRAYSSPECDDEGAIGAPELAAADAAIAKAAGAPSVPELRANQTQPLINPK
jgi:hypothetical protein